MKRFVFLISVCVITAVETGSAGAWQMAKAALMTRWASQVSPTHCHSEYPRPQFVRSDWQNLNGLWDYAIRPTAEEIPTNYDGQILVPFPVESALSGVMKPLLPDETLCYHRVTRIPAAWKGNRIRLQFGAVDFSCKVLINGHKVGEHRGGYSRFAFDITDYLHWDEPEDIIVAVTDTTQGDQPRGKQSLNPQGIFYSACSGIWQTVWLEPTPPVCIDGLRLTPDVDARALRLVAAVNSLDDSLEIEAVASAGGVVAGRVSGPAGAELALPLANPHLWSPGDPFLYDLRVTLKKGTRALDRVGSYFGMRQIALQRDRQGLMRIAVNNDPLFQIGTLDQGFWPDGIYTAPTDEALKSDLMFLKAAGFNMTRKHVKIEPDRWYYWCDKLGLLVWQDMPSGNNSTPEGQREFEAELFHMVKDLYDHPSLVVWILFNEGWGQYDTQRLTHSLKALDPSRLVDDASGWADAHVGDIIDAHSYPGPPSLESEARRATAVGEFGGLGMIPDGHCWSTNHNWSYRTVPDSKALEDAYWNLLRQVWGLHHLHGLSAAVYTQTTDVETECNGLLSYDRAVAKIPAQNLAKANAVGRDLIPGRVIMPDAISSNVTWSYSFQAPGSNWFESAYNVAAWREGTAGFGTPDTPGALVHTLWNTDDIWLRRQFTLGSENLRGLKLEIHHDEDLEVYFNGVLAAKLPGYIEHYQQFDIRPEALAALKPGPNTIAAHCHQTTGGQYVDIGLIIPNGTGSP